MRKNTNLMHSRTSRALVCATALLLACLIALVAVPQRALAEEGDVETVTSEQGTLLNLGRDYVWAGNVLSIDGKTIDNDLLFAGQSLEASNVRVAGSIRAAGKDISVSDAAVTENLSLAGETVVVEGGTANDASLAAATARFAGTCETLHVYGNEVIIDGTVNGDAYVGAGTVKIGSDAKIGGTLHVDAAAQPTIPASASIGDMDFTLDESSSFSMIGDTDVSALVDGISRAMRVMGILISLVGTLLVALCSELFFRRQTQSAAQMLRQRTGSTIVSGIIGAIAIPVAIAILFCLIVTIPVAGALIFGFIGLAIASTGFMAAAIARMFLQNMNRMLGAVLCGLVVGVLCLVPVLRVVIPIVAFILMLGYVIQRVYLSMRGRDLEQPAESETVGF